MADSNLFGYTGSQSMVRTNPVNVNVKPDMRASNAFDSILNLTKTSLDFATTVKKEESKQSLISAGNDANTVHDWYQQEIVKTEDEYKRQEILDTYKTALQSVQDGYDLKPEYKQAFENSNIDFVRKQEMYIGEQVHKRKVKDTSDGLTSIAVSLAGANSADLIPVMKDATSAYTNLGLTQEEASDKVFSIFMSSKINAITADNIMQVDLNKIKADKDEIIKQFDPRLTGKELDVKLTDVLEKTKREQSRAVTEYLNDYVKNEHVGNKAFAEQLNQFSHALTPIEMDNFRQTKSNILEDKRIREEARAERANYKADKAWTKDAMALMADPTKTPEEIKSFLDVGVSKGFISDIERNSFVNREIKAADIEKAKAVKEANNKELGIIQYKASTGDFGVDQPQPKEYANMVGIKHGGVLTEEAIKDIVDYGTKYNIANNSAVATQVMNTNAMTLPKEVVKSTTEAMNTYSKQFTDYSKFNADGILKIYNNYKQDGDLVKKFTADINNPNGALGAVLSFNKLRQADDTTTINMLGADLYAQMTTLATRLTPGKDGSYALAPNDVRDVGNTFANKKNLPPIDLKDFHKEAKDNIWLYNDTEKYKALLLAGKTSDDAIDILKQEYEKKNPAPGVSMGYYPKPLTKDEVNLVKRIPDYLSQISNGEITGIHYEGDKFYYSTPKDKKYAVIEEKTPDGKFRAFSNITDVYAYINTDANNKIKETTAYKVDTYIKGIPDKLLKMNPTISKEDVPLAKQVVDFIKSPYKDINKEK